MACSRISEEGGGGGVGRAENIRALKIRLFTHNEDVVAVIMSVAYIQNITHTIVELCAIHVRDGVANCDVMSCTDASNMIDLISLESFVVYNHCFS